MIEVLEKMPKECLRTLVDRISYLLKYRQDSFTWQTVVGLTGLAQRVGTRVRHDTAFWRQLAWRKDV